MEAGSGGIGLTVWHKGGSRCRAAWGMFMDMSSINLSPKQQDCEGEGEWKHRVCQNRQWDQAWGRPGMFLWKFVTFVAICLDAELYRIYFLNSPFVLRKGSSTICCFFELNFPQDNGKRWQALARPFMLLLLQNSWREAGRVITVRTVNFVPEQKAFIWLCFPTSTLAFFFFYTISCKPTERTADLQHWIRAPCKDGLQAGFLWERK